MDKIELGKKAENKLRNLFKEKIVKQRIFGNIMEVNHTNSPFTSYAYVWIPKEPTFR